SRRAAETWLDSRNKTRTAYEAGTAKVIKGTAEKRGPIDDEWRIESPAKGTVKNAVSGDEGITTKAWRPIPAATDPAGAIVAVTHVDARSLRVGFSQVRRTQTAPLIKVALFVFVFVKATGLEFAAVQVKSFSSAG